MKKLFTAIIAFMTISLSASAIDIKGAEAFVQNLTNEGIEELINSDADSKTKIQKFKELFDKNLDLDFIGKFVLGRYYRTATPQQRSAFMKAYKDYNVRTWSGRFDEFKGRTFDFKGSSPSNSKNQIFVNTTVNMGEGQEPAKVVWRVLEENNGSFRVVDIIIENVSLAISARNEYTAFIKNNSSGIDALTKKLEG